MDTIEKCSGVSMILQDETSPEQNLERRLSRYGKCKHHTETVTLDFIIHTINSHPQPKSREYQELKKIARELRECGSFLIFRHFYTIGEFKLVGGCTCKRHLLCMLCALRRAAKQLVAYLKRFDQVMKDNPGLKLVLITFTVKNGDDLEERFNHLDDSLRTITKRRGRMLSGSRSRNTVFVQVHGAVWTFEVTNKGNGWHPHCHMLALVDQDTYVEAFQEHLTNEWKEITGDSFILDVRLVNTSDQDNKVGGFCEVFKYALKTNDMTPDKQFIAFLTLRRKRLIASLGCIRGVQVSEDLNDEPLDDETLEYVDLLYMYTNIHGYQQIE